MNITYDDITLMIGTILIYFLGFYFGRRQMLSVVIISLITVFSSIESIVLHGEYTLDVTIYNVVITTIYAALWWGIGYVMGSLVFIRKGDTGKVHVLMMGQ